MVQMLEGDCDRQGIRMCAVSRLPTLSELAQTAVERDAKAGESVASQESKVKSQK